MPAGNCPCSCAKPRKKSRTADSSALIRDVLAVTVLSLSAASVVTGTDGAVPDSSGGEEMVT